MNNLERWQIIQERDEINNRWLRVRNVTFKLPNNKIMENYFIVERPSVVIIIPIKNNQTFLIREYERGVDEVGHKFPSGHIDPNEKPVESAQRELGEELGIQGIKLHFLGESYVDPGNLNKRAYYFIALEVIDAKNLKEENPFELFEGEWVDFTGLQKMIKNNEIKNQYVVVGWTLANMFLQLNMK